jgi:hypothetical protein
MHVARSDLDKKMKSLTSSHELYAEYTTIISAAAVDLVKLANVGKKLKLAGFKAESDACFQACVKALNDFAKAGQIDNSFVMEVLIYGAFVKTTETEEHYNNCFKLWAPTLQRLGRAQQKPLRQHRDPRKICFVIQNAVLLGHTEVMLKTVDAWIDANLNVEIWLAAFGGVDPNFAKLLEQRSIKLIEPLIFKGQKIPLSQAFLLFRQQLDDFNINTVVWVSVPTSASYALAMRLAPRQVFWALKFHPIYVPEVDVHICGGHKSESVRIYNDNTWSVAPFPLTVALKDNQSEDVKAFRRKFPDDVVLLGTLAREEKINSPEFLSAVCTILSRNPTAHYLWTGRQQPETVLAAFQNAGVAARCHFIGWVDTNLVAEAIDIFLETFPFGCGVTGYQAMGHGTPLLSMQATDTLYSLVVPLRTPDQPPPSTEELEELEILTAANPQHYVDLAQKMISDPIYRGVIGNREKNYFADQLRDLPNYALRLWREMSGLNF